MHYLIDGHNLIAKMPDISLDDPNDEVKLVLRLRSWAGTGRKRRVTVIFDGGLPGGKSRRLSSGPVKVLFATTGQPADTLLINRLSKVKNPAEFMLVTSDQEIVKIAAGRRIRTISSEKFVIQMQPQPEGQPEDAAGETIDPSISPEEVNEWLALFGPEPPAQPKTRRAPARKASGKSRNSASKRPARSSEDLKRGEQKLESDDLDAWLDLFTRPSNDDR